ncbi:hypothetical protein MRB53_025366 [Persea americana]|uniref:Uncharacterized protein n=1 Tax=Persea americana TaxID=3435 RepID=A0ACC2LFK0_PERAE|nr:hypothetical protein MRB53_025366 [Persea americana]
MGSETRPLHVLFSPLMAQGHIIPMTDIAKLFALRQGVQVSIVTTPLDATRITSTIDRHRTTNITIHLLQLPCSEAGFPDGCETLDSAISLGMVMAFSKALTLLQQPFERLLQRHRPDCIVSDTFLPCRRQVGCTETGVQRVQLLPPMRLQRHRQVLVPS